MRCRRDTLTLVVLLTALVIAHAAILLSLSTLWGAPAPLERRPHADGDAWAHGTWDLYWPCAEKPNYHIDLLPGGVYGCRYRHTPSTVTWNGHWRLEGTVLHVWERTGESGDYHTYSVGMDGSPHLIPEGKTYHTGEMKVRVTRPAPTD